MIKIGLGGIRKLETLVVDSTVDGHAFTRRILLWVCYLHASQTSSQTLTPSTICCENNHDLLCDKLQAERAATIFPRS
ncbi:hypothetical protein DAI22_07g078800 [Oryza sativa Japonica Group]|nr:hypothetical protein DAI22_07g078800 [Oryza sativa Japonica Group]